LGITTLYLSLPYSKNSVYTLEGSEEIAKIASANFKRLKRDNIHLLQGEFNETLPSALQTMGIVDFVYIDGNHKELPTLSYFEMCLKHAKQNSVFVFDDIHWSKEMESAWNKIKSHKSVTLSIDLYQFGIIFFRSGMTKEDFILKF
jgi:predicted O-methyltransferase YrrM